MTTDIYIKREDIRKGDTIRAEFTTSDVIISRTGVAYQKDGDGDWMSEKGQFITYRDRIAGSEKYVLVDRPKKALPTKTGSVIIATRIRGENGRWPLFLDNDGDWVSAEEIDGTTWHDPEVIGLWVPAEVVEVSE